MQAVETYEMPLIARLLQDCKVGFSIPDQLLLQVAIPDALSDMAAAQFFINPMTVYGMLSVRLESLSTPLRCDA